MGIGGLVLLLALSWATGTDFVSMVGGGGGVPATDAPGEFQTTPEEEYTVDLVDQVAGGVQDTWSRLLGNRYQPTRVFLFRDATDESGCGFAQAATGPFYCPRDGKVYLDVSFFRELSEGLGAPGEFAQAYVIAHEFGHHVQNLLGYTERAQADRRSGPESASVALELQADCFAGVWGHDAAKGGGRVGLDPGDAEAGMAAAAAIGDDRLQKKSTGRVAPERFTHGTSAQRMEWLRRGMETGDPAKCDTF